MKVKMLMLYPLFSAMHLYHAPYGMAELGIGEEIPSVRKQH